MSAPWTPGPWKIYLPGEHECPGIDNADCSVSIVIFGDKLTFDEDCGVQGRTVEEAAANARLIAEAPAMAELLEQFDEYMRGTADPPDCLLEARALLARVKGEG